MTDDIEQRVIELEIKLAHQDRLLDDLNDVIIEQRAAIDALERRMQLAEKSLVVRQDDPANERPPHY